MIRKAKQSDVKPIEKLLKRIPNFSRAEVDVAMELVNIACSNPSQDDYHLYVKELDDKILGYYCIGRRPLTDAVFDLYWIVSDRESGIKGIGKSLLEHAEAFVIEKNGRWLLIETSSKESYSGSRNFYLRNNFSIISQINDFYAIGDNLLVFGKYFSK